MEAHGTELDCAYDEAKQMLRLQTERGTVLRQSIRACRKGGTVSVVGVYGGLLDKFPMGAIVNKSLTLRSGQQPGQRYAKRLFEHIQQGELDPSFLLTHRMSLEDAPQGYAMFKDKSGQRMRAVFQP
jgi:threonine dehydrogenase-like Zn-dependent dehydrogenase